MVQVDAGDLLVPLPIQPPIPDWIPPDRGEVERRARLLFAGLARVGLDAWTPGEADLAALGVARLKALAEGAKIPVLSSNLVDAKGKPLFPSERLIERAGVKIGLLGLTTGDAAAMKSAGVIATDPVGAATAAVTVLRRNGAQIVIALGHFQDGTVGARKLASKVSGIDWIVLGHTGENLATPERADKTGLLGAYVQGKHLGRLDLHVVGGSFTFSDRGPGAQLQATRDDQRRQLADVEKRAKTDPSGELREFYERQRKSIQDEIARTEQLLAAQPVGVKGSWYENRVIPLDTSFPDHPGLALLVRQYNDENQRRAAKGLPVGVAARPPGQTVAAAGAAPPPERPEDYRYVGSNACGGCHQPALAHWQKTKHAHAVATLRKLGRDKDPACVGCHVTGFLREGGTQQVKTALERFPEVGCEACHGPGLAHVTAENKKTSIARAVPEATCRGCHTPDQAGAFEYAAFVKAILGPGHGAPAPK